MITDTQLAEWKSLAEKATAAPWTNPWVDGNPNDHIEGGDGDWVIWIESVDGCRLAIQDRDAAFITMAREAVPALVVEVEQLRVALAARQRKSEERKTVISLLLDLRDSPPNDVYDHYYLIIKALED